MPKYFFLKNFINKNEAKSYSLKMFEASKNGEFYVDDQCNKSESFYNHKMFEELLEKTRRLVEKKTNVNLQSTFSYARIYKKGEVLSKHMDRNACEYSATITLDYSGEKPWNFHFKNKKEESILINIGDIFIYDGVNLPHWRNALKDEWQTQVMLFFSKKEKEKVHDEEKYKHVFNELYLKSKK